ncbi:MULTISPECIES: PadR family transcriptional regulator [Caldisericum]|uniref:Transcription regulator PadR N-terminal domain-containing protein n=2 Tax=Caldisericum exile TaxID=693075 RepID=A0A2J6WFK7_9BACT|nr:MAG: hypothetical protein C0189_01035 [Caldisericum exile]
MGGIFDFCDKKKNFFVASVFGARQFITFYILHLVHEKPLYGEAISKKVTELLSNLWQPSPGFMYPILKRLESHGLIKGKWDYSEAHPRYIYEITEKGKAEYFKYKEVFETKLDELIQVLENVKKEVFNK